METQLQQNSCAFESCIDEMKSKQNQELCSLREQIKSQNEKHLEVLHAKSLEIDDLKGRLAESRKSREIALEESQMMRKKYSERVKHLEEKFEKEVESIRSLEKDSVSKKLQEYELQVEKLKEENKKIVDQLNAKTKEADKNEEEIEKLSESNKTLTSSIEKLQKEVTKIHINSLKNLHSSNIVFVYKFDYSNF